VVEVVGARIDVLVVVFVLVDRVVGGDVVVEIV
jgi:hypothetical protein